MLNSDPAADINALARVAYRIRNGKRILNNKVRRRKLPVGRAFRKPDCTSGE